MTNLIIGNIISLAAAGFMAYSCCLNDHRRVFFYQAIECAMLCVASVFFGAWAGITTLRSPPPAITWCPGINSATI